VFVSVKITGGDPQDRARRRPAQSQKRGVPAKRSSAVAAIPLFAISLSAQSRLGVEAGANVGYDFYSFDSSVYGLTVVQSTHKVTAGGFPDPQYARIAASFTSFLAGSDESTGSAVPFPADTSISYFSATLVAEYPFGIGPVKLWPAIGVLGELPLTYRYNSFDFLSDASNCDFTNLAVMAGIGVDIPFRLSIFLSRALVSLAWGEETGHPTHKSPLISLGVR